VDFNIDLSGVNWETVFVSGLTAFVASLFASLTATRIYRRQRRHDLEDRWADIRAELVRHPMPEALASLKLQLATTGDATADTGEQTVALARGQVESVSRAAAGLPAGERKKYIAPIERSLNRMEDADAPPTDGDEQAPTPLDEQLRELVHRLETFDDHLRVKATTSGGRRSWLGIIRR